MKYFYNVKLISDFECSSIINQCYNCEYTLWLRLCVEICPSLKCEESKLECPNCVEPPNVIQSIRHAL